MKNILPIITVITSVLLVVAVLLQNQSAGLGAAFGGESSFYRTKRGAEKFLFIFTIGLSVIFIACLIALIFV